MCKNCINKKSLKYYFNKRTVYSYRKLKYFENVFCGYSLIFVGILGLVFLLLAITDIITIKLSENVKLITYITAFIIFGILLLIGIKSLSLSKKSELLAKEEAMFTIDILEWFKKNVTSELLDNGVDSQINDELKYSMRICNIKALLEKTFGDMNEEYSKKLADEIYKKFF